MKEPDVSLEGRSFAAILDVKGEEVIVIACPNCGRKLRVRNALAGRRANCPVCKVPFDIPPNIPECFDTDSQQRPVVQSDSVPPQITQDQEEPPPLDSQTDMGSPVEEQPSIASQNDRGASPPEFTNPDVPVLVPIKAGAAEPEVSTTQPRSGQFDEVCYKLADLVVSRVTRASPSRLWLVRLIMAVALVVLVCLLEFSQRMGWNIPAKGLSAILGLTGIGMIVIGALAKSLTDVLLGVVAVVATISTPLITGLIFSNHLFRRPNPMLVALVACSGLVRVLVTAFAVVSIIGICAAVSRDGSKRHD